MGIARRVGDAMHIGDDDEVASLQRRAHAAGIGQADRRIGAGDPQRLDAAVARPRRTGRPPSGPACVAMSRRAPEPPTRSIAAGVVERHVRGQLVGEAADLAPAHGVGLAGERERPQPGRPIRPVARWQLMMALTLSVPCADWFTPWLIDGEAPLGRARTSRRSARHPPRDSPHPRRDLVDAAGIGVRQSERGVEAGRVRVDVGAIERALVREMCQQAVEQQHVGAGL